MTVRIVVDSTSDIGLERAARYGITVVPVIVTFGDQEFRDGIDLGAARFYSMLASSTILPKTAAPSIGTFEETYRRLVAAGASGILSIHVTSLLSATYNAALQAAAEVSSETGTRIQVLDSRTVSVGFGLPALLAAGLAAEGASLESVSALAQHMLDRGRLYILLDTLEYLHKGGRISRAAALVGTVLDVKPILTVKDGEIFPVERARSRGKALARVVDLVRALGPVRHLALATSDDVVAAEFTSALQPAFSGSIETSHLGAAIATYAGPHAGLLFAVPDTGPGTADLATFAADRSEFTSRR